MPADLFPILVIQVFEKDDGVAFQPSRIDHDRDFDRAAPVPEMDLELCLKADIFPVFVLHNGPGRPVHEDGLQGIGLTGSQSVITYLVRELRLFLRECDVVAFRRLCLVIGCLCSHLHLRDLIIVDRSAVDDRPVPVDRDVIGDQFVSFICSTPQLLHRIGVIGQRALRVIRLYVDIRLP